MVGQWQGALSIQMGEYLFDHRGILNRGNDPEGGGEKMVEARSVRVVRNPEEKAA